jgi:hypothetical protein
MRSMSGRVVENMNGPGAENGLNDLNKFAATWLSALGSANPVFCASKLNNSTFTQAFKRRN